MYDSNGCPIVAFQDVDMLEVFGTLASKRRKQHHRVYLDRFDKERVYPLVASVFASDPLYEQYMRTVSPKYKKMMLGRIVMDLVKASLLYFQYPQRQHFTYEGLLQGQILFLRKLIFMKYLSLINFGYTEEPVIKITVPKAKLNRMGKRLADILEQPVYKIFPDFLKAVEIDEKLKLN